MESKAKYALVGTIVIVFCIGLVAAILWLSDATGTTATTQYAIYFKNYSLSGLQVDSDVTMKGIKVGSVKSFRISPKDIERVKVQVRLNADTPVKTDTKAVIRRNLLTGLARVDLTGSTAKSERLTAIPKNEQRPVIPEGETELDALASSIPGLVEKVGEITSKVSLFFSEENGEAISATLGNMKAFSAEMVGVKDELREVILNLNELSQKMLSMSDSLGRAAKSADKNMDALSRELTKALSHVGNTAKTLDKESATLSKAMRAAIDVILLDINTVSKDVSSAAQSFAAAMENLEDPKSLLVGPSKRSLGPGEEAQK